MVAFLTQVQGAGSVNPTDPQITPIVVPSTSYTLALTQTYRRRTKRPNPPMTTLNVPEPFGLGTSSGGPGVFSSPTREETEPMPHDAPLSTCHIVGSAEGSTNYRELMEICTKLTKQVATLEEDLARTKKEHKKVLTALVSKVKKLKEDVKLLKAKRKKKIVESSPTSEDKDLDDDFGDSPK